jgi:hypothetical protein
MLTKTFTSRESLSPQGELAACPGFCVTLRGGLSTNATPVAGQATSINHQPLEFIFRQRHATQVSIFGRFTSHMDTFTVQQHLKIALTD